MSDHANSPSAEEDSSGREARDAEEEFRETCSRAVVSLCTRHHYDMLLDKDTQRGMAAALTDILRAGCQVSPARGSETTF